MFSGMVCTIEFKTLEAETKFLSWVIKGNSKSEVLGNASLFLMAKIKKVADFKYIFCWEHAFMFPMAIFLRLMFHVVTFNIRKSISIRSINKVELFNVLR
jgi:hypothetical protein